MARRAVVEACDHLARTAPAFREIVDRAGPARLVAARPRATYFGELVRAICFQQLAGPAARTIHGRVVALFGGADPSPEALLALPLHALRGAGLSANKAASVRDLSERVLVGDVELQRMPGLSVDEVVRELTLVRGIGRWTAEMFLMFQLGRLDVWPVDDLGVRKGYARLHQLGAMPTAKALQPLGDELRPYRSVAAWYCWRAADSGALD